MKKYALTGLFLAATAATAQQYPENKIILPTAAEQISTILLNPQLTGCIQEFHRHGTGAYVENVTTQAISPDVQKFEIAASVMQGGDQVIGESTLDITRTATQGGRGPTVYSCHVDYKPR